jgi:hypothetical protein
MQKFLSNQKLWKIIQEPDGYYYEIKLAGMIIDRKKVDDSVLQLLKERILI